MTIPSTTIGSSSDGCSGLYLKYVLITPARNEAAFIELTLKSVVAQTIKPLKWVIVSDGSTDGTDDIVRRYMAEHGWIELVRAPERQERHFAGKVHAFNTGYAKVRDLDYDVIASLDADISFETDYFSFLLQKLSENPRLGVTGTPFIEGTASYNYRFTSRDHVSGACQVFRRECFESIGGYVPIKAGGIDLVAVVTARMRGWHTRTFTDKVLLHHRIMGTGQHHAWMVAFKGGYHDYLMGVHPLWQIPRSLYQMTRKPLVAGGLLLLAGYCWAAVKRPKRPVSEELVAFRRKEQMQRLGESFRKVFCLRACCAPRGPRSC
jgi:poly-beta-1,6-N-acetyl-D-glucosamine synthase